MSSRSIWRGRGVILFAALVVLKNLAERRPEKFAILLMVAGIFGAVVMIGWLFALQRDR